MKDRGFNTLCRRFESIVGARPSKTSENKTACADFAFRLGGYDSLLTLFENWATENVEYLAGRPDGLREFVRYLRGEKISMPKRMVAPREQRQIQAIDEEIPHIADVRPRRR
jgi:hypothetical protein